MNSEFRRARLLAFCLDFAVPVFVADGAALLLAAALWRLAPAGRDLAVWLFPAAGAAAVGSFLLRDARGGRARRWLALEIRDRQGPAPGRWGSIRRNLPLLVPGWNLIDAWPVFSNGLAPRRCDRSRGFGVAASSDA
jgi:hypothetical protein